MNIVPMILITFVENVFKHGVSSHEKRRGVYYHSRSKKENYYWQQTILY